MNSNFTSMEKRTNSALPLILLDATPPPALPASSPVLMLKFEESVEDRFRKILFLPIAGSDCDGAGNKLLPLAQAMHEDASQLGVTTEQRMVVSLLLFEVETTTLGYEVALKNAQARGRELDKSRKRPASQITAPQVR